MKEELDYYYNQVWKGLSPLAASKDKIHDRKVNEIGRQRAKSGVYTSSKDGCHSFRVKGINGKYSIKKVDLADSALCLEYFCTFRCFCLRLFSLFGV